jgi:hypothetical protein
MKLFNFRYAKIFVIVLVAFFALSGCPTSIDDDSESQKEVTIYMAGYSEGRVPCYWINEEVHLLNPFNEPVNENIHRNTTIRDIAAHNGMIYVVGSTSLYGTGLTELFPGQTSQVILWQTSQAVLWIDGVQTILSEGVPACATSLLFYENDLYVSGWYLQDNKPKACYWKNGIPHILDSASENISGASCLFIEDDIVYAGGARAEEVSEGGLKDFASCWIDGIMYSYGDESEVLDIYKLNDTIIMAGRYHYRDSPNTSGFHPNRFIWKKEGADFSSFIWKTDDSISDATIVNGDIYFVGSDARGRACYWVNDTYPPFHLPMDSTTSGRSGGSAEHIFVYENKLYITGYVSDYYVDDMSSRNTTCYWIDNVRHELPKGTGRIECIYVSR